MPWGGHPVRQPLRFACLLLEMIATEGYLCYAETPSRESISPPGSDSYLHDFWRYPMGAPEWCSEWVCKKDAMQSFGVDVQVPPKDEASLWFVHTALPTCLFIAAELVLLYAAFRIGRYSGFIRTDVIKRLKERLMEMMDIDSGRPTSGPMESPLPGAAVGKGKNIPASTLPSGVGVDMDTVRHEVSLPKKADLGAEEILKEVVNPAKVAWGGFISAFRKRDAHEPFPSLQVADDISETDVGALLVEDGIGIGNLLLDCRDCVKRREIAKEFLSRFPAPESEWAMASVLITADDDTTYWVAGDIHAKVSAIAKICAVIADRHNRGLTKKRNILILLGDYVDRGDEPLETLAFIESLKLKSLFDGFEVITLKGNHDVGLSRDADGNYVSMVSPAETAEFLQKCVNEGQDVSVEADAAIRLAMVAPRMCELTEIDPTDPNRTMLFVHGGVPHVDLQEKLYLVRNTIPQKEPFFKSLTGDSVSEELRRSCAEDFTWIRFSKDLPVKQPNRGSRGCEIGTEDVSQYISLHRALTTRDITFIFRGHDHERPGFACYSPHPVLNPTKKKFAQRECNVLTLNAMEPDCSSNGMFRERDLVLAEWAIGNPVRLHRINTHHLETNKLVSMSSEVSVEPEAPEASMLSEGRATKSVAQPDHGVPPIVQPEELLQTNPLEPSPAQTTPEDEEEVEKHEIF